MLTLSNYVLCLSRRCFCCCCCTDAECVSIIVAVGCCIFFHSVLLADILSIRNESCDEGDGERERECAHEMCGFILSLSYFVWRCYLNRMRRPMTTLGSRSSRNRWPYGEKGKPIRQIMTSIIN